MNKPAAGSPTFQQAIRHKQLLEVCFHHTALLVCHYQKGKKSIVFQNKEFVQTQFCLPQSHRERL